MLDKFRRVGVVAALAVLLNAWVGSSSAQAPPSSTGFQSLTLTLSIPARTFLLLEPVPLTLTLENRTAEPVVAHAALGFSDRAVELFVQPEGLPAYRVDRLSPVAIRGRITPLTLPPGYRRVSTEPLLVSLQKVFPAAGKYTIQAVLHDLKGDEIRSNVASIEVLQPAGLEQVAYHSILESGHADFFFAGADAAGDAERYEEYETFARIFDGTVYADYANLSLGQLNEARGQIDTARKFFSSETKRSEYAAQKAAEALKRLPAR